MFITRTSPRLLGTRRIDPDYYAPVHVADEKRLRHFGSFELGDCGRFFVGPFGSELPSSLYRPSGVPLLRVGNIGQLDMNEDNLVFLDEATHKQLEASETLPGDLLIVKVSVGEKICRFPTRYDRGNITQHIIGIRPNGYADMDYVATALFSPIGRRQLERRSLGSIIQYLGVVDARTVLVPRITPDAQRYIGDKVRQAERLRERARATQARLNQLLAVDLVDTALATIDTCSIRLSAQDLRHRLDSKFYGRRAFSVYRACVDDGGVKVGDLHPSISNGFEYRQFTSDGRPYLTVSEMSSGRLELASAPRIPWDVPVPEKARITTSCVLVVRGGSIGFAACVHGDDTSAAVSSDLIRLEFDSEEKAAAVGLFLNSAAGRCLQHKVSYGGVMPKLGQDELLDIPVPGSLLARADKLLRCFNEREAAARSSSRLTNAAKALVEHLIDGRLNEADLVAAQKALDAGDRSADREILKGLRQSDAPDAKPLIADVDALYALLDEPEGRDA